MSGSSGNGKPLVILLSPLAKTSWSDKMSVRLGKHYRFDCVPLDVTSARPAGKVLAPWRAWRQMLAADIVFSSDAHVSLGAALLMCTLFNRKPHVALTFNLVNRERFHPALDLLARRVIPDITFFVTPSDHERHVFSEAYGIPLERFAFEHWGVGPPTVPDPATLPGEFVDCVAEREPFFCAIGRNNRDFRTFSEALRGAPYNGVIVAMRGLFENEDVPPNVSVLHDLPYDQCQHLIAHSVANVVPVKESGIGAGHITMVHAMHMGKAQIVTTLPALADYFIPGEHGLGVGRGSAEEMRAAMDHLLGNPEDTARMGAAARAYAARWLSGNHHVPMMCAILDALEGKAPFPDSPPGWREWRAGLANAGSP